MTVEELIARLQEMPYGATVKMSVPQPGDDLYDVAKLERWGEDTDDEWLVLQGPDQ